MYRISPPKTIKWVSSAWLYWTIPGNNKSLYLTFDDGPTPGVTNVVLDILKKYKAKATFFCLGQNVIKYPQLFDRIISEGHTVGSHGFSHLNGWKTPMKKYVHNVSQCRQIFSTNLFRPPYGKIGFKQLRILSMDYRIIMWNVMSCDYDSGISADKCAKNVIKKAKKGSIIVFHDSLKASTNCLNSLPVVLQHFAKKGFTFDNIDFRS